MTGTPKLSEMHPSIGSGESPGFFAVPKLAAEQGPENQGFHDSFWNRDEG
jgi:hypothetical protein